VTADLLDIAAAEGAYAAVAAEEMMTALGTELVATKIRFATEQAERFRLDDGRPVPALGADRAIALARSGAQIDVCLEADGAAVATSCVCLQHASFKPLVWTTDDGLRGTGPGYLPT
jgi:hypothetical protein